MEENCLGCLSPKSLTKTITEKLFPRGPPRRAPWCATSRRLHTRCSIIALLSGCWFTPHLLQSTAGGSAWEQEGHNLPWCMAGLGPGVHNCPLGCQNQQGGWAKKAWICGALGFLTSEPRTQALSAPPHGAHEQPRSQVCPGALGHKESRIPSSQATSEEGPALGLGLLRPCRGN